MPRSAIVTAFIVGLAAFIIDQASKFFAIEKIPTTGIFLIQQSWFNLELTVTKNTGLAFGFVSSGVISTGLIFITLGIILALLQKALVMKNPTLLITLSIIFAAALSNIFDRLLHGGVIDFLSFSIYNLHWPTFNLADALITIAAVLLIIKWPSHQSTAIAG